MADHNIVKNIRMTPEELQAIQKKMEQFGTTNFSALVRKMAIDGYVVKPELPELKQSLGNSTNIKGFGMQVNDNGASSFFAVMDKAFKAQTDRLEKQRAEKKEEKKAAQKKAEKKEREEQLEEKRLKNKDSQEVVITANSIEELKKKIDDYNYLQMADTVKTDAEKYLGRTIDFKG